MSIHNITDRAGLIETGSAAEAKKIKTNVAETQQKVSAAVEDRFSSYDLTVREDQDKVFAHQHHLALNALRTYRKSDDTGAKTAADLYEETRRTAADVIAAMGKESTKAEGATAVSGNRYGPYVSVLAGPGYGNAYAVRVNGAGFTPAERTTATSTATAESVTTTQSATAERSASVMKDPSSSFAELIFGTEEEERSAVNNNGTQLSEEEKKEVEELKARDAEVRAHENAHKAAGGTHAGSPSYSYTRGPDGKSYASDGEVSIDLGRESDPQDTIEKMQQVQRAATAPAEPSAQDRRVFSEAARKEAEARAELAEERRRENIENTTPAESNRPTVTTTSEGTRTSAEGSNSNNDSDTVTQPAVNVNTAEGTENVRENKQSSEKDEQQSASDIDVAAEKTLSSDNSDDVPDII